MPSGTRIPKAELNGIGCACPDLGYLQACSEGTDVTNARDVPYRRESEVLSDELSAGRNLDA